MSGIRAINASSAINYGPTILTQRDGGGNSGEFIECFLKRAYEQTLALSRKSSINFKGLKKIVKDSGEKLDRVV